MKSDFSFVYGFDLKNEYHFDHPLDHIPGSYLMDAIFEKMNDFYPDLLVAHKFKINFKTFAELNEPITFNFKFIEDSLNVDVIQKNEVITNARLSHFREHHDAKRTSHDFTTLYGKPNAKELNKHKSVNVALSALDKNLKATSLTLKMDHPLQRNYMAHSYVFELAKQYLYLYGREVGHIEKDSKMSVFGIETSIDRKISPESGFLVRIKEKTYSEYNNKQFSKSIVEIEDIDGVCALTVIEGVVK